MKRVLSMILAAALLLTACGVFFFSAGAGTPVFWEAAKGAVRLKNAPTLTRITAEADETGTVAYAYFHASSDCQALAQARASFCYDDTALLASLLGEKASAFSDVQLQIGVQIAYSFDGGKNWVNDRDSNGEYPYLSMMYDADGDGFTECLYLPTDEIRTEWMNDSMRLLHVNNSAFTPRFASPPEGWTVEQTLSALNKGTLQGKGIFCGKNYDPDGAYADCGFYVDFSKETITAKARYITVTRYTLKKGGAEEPRCEIRYSEWSANKTYNDQTSAYTDQGCVPDKKQLSGNTAITLSICGQQTKTVNGVKQRAYLLQVQYPAALETALSKVYPLEKDDALSAATGGATDGPCVMLEIKVGDGKWYFLDSFSHNEPFYAFDTSDPVHGSDVERALENLGVKAGDRVYLRARLVEYPQLQWEYDWINEAEDRGAYIVTPKQDSHFLSAPSAPVELNLSGVYRVDFVLNGGAFAPDAARVTAYSDDTPAATVDLTAKTFLPTRAHYTFDGWYEDEACSAGKKITAFNLSEKRSRTLYAKWTEKPFYTVSYELGAAQGFVNNTNPVKIYADAGTVVLSDAANDKLDFDGWYTAASGGARVTSLSYAGMKNNLTLYARWKEKAIVPAVWGDADANGKVEAADARLALRFAVGLETFSDAQRAWCDVDTPSAARKITAADARIVLRMAVGLDSVEKLGLPAKPVGI